jgi:hypothetical protein
MAYKVFTNGSVLQASEVNDNLMNQAVITFVDSAARTSAITTPVEGMLTYLTGTDLYQFWNGSAWTNLIPAAGTPAVVQLKTTTKADTFSTSSTSLTDVTGLSVSITPTSASNKILVTTSFIAQSTNSSGGEVMQFTFADGSNNNLIVPTSPGNRLGCFYSSPQINASGGSAGAASRTIAATLIHSPATTSAVTYKVRVRHSDSGGGGGTAFVNRSSDDADSINRPRGVAIITAMEVAP